MVVSVPFLLDGLEISTEITESLLLLSSLDLSLCSALDFLLSGLDFLLWLSANSWLLLESILNKELVINCIDK